MSDNFNEDRVSVYIFDECLDQSQLIKPNAPVLWIVCNSEVTNEDAKLLSDYSENFEYVHLCVSGYGQRLDISYLTKLKNLKSFALYNYEFDNYSQLNLLPSKLESISLGEPKSKRHSLSFLSKFTSLKCLFVHGLKKDIECIGKIKSLVELTFRSITLPDLDFLKSLENLESLDVKLGGIKDFSVLKNIKKLNYLELWQINKLEDISFISNLLNLKSLHLESLPRVQSLPNLSNLKDLEAIYMSNMKEVKSITALIEAPSLKRLTHFDIKNISVDTYIL